MGPKTVEAKKRRPSTDASPAALLWPVARGGSPSGAATADGARKRRLTATPLTESSPRPAKKQRREQRSGGAVPSSSGAPNNGKAAPSHGDTAGQQREGLSSSRRKGHDEEPTSKRCTRSGVLAEIVRSRERLQHCARRLLQRFGVRFLEQHEVDAMERLKRECLGDGGYGTCFRTVRPSTREEMVVKTFHDDSLQDLVVEAVNLHLLQTAGVQRLFGVCVEACLLVTHYAGVAADEYFSCPRPFGEGVSVLLQVARVLQTMHEHGFTHNDLKGTNVCVAVSRAGPVATVIDVGLARMRGSWGPYNKLQDGTLMRWVAPELFEHLHPTSEASDVFSLAVMIQDMGQLQDWCTNRPSQQVLTVWVQDALRLDPEERPPLAKAVVLLEALLEEATRSLFSSASFS